MKSFSFNLEEIDGNLYFKVWSIINENKGYFYKCWGGLAQEAMQLTLYHCIEHYDSTKGALKFYIIKVGKDILRKKEKLVYINYIENIPLYSDYVLKDTSSDKKEGLKTESDYLGTYNDITDSVFKHIYESDELHGEIIELALSYMSMFVTMCEAILTGDSTNKNYSKEFKQRCFSMARKSSNFNNYCTDLYESYKDKMQIFTEYDRMKYAWTEADFRYLNSNRTNRVSLVGEDGEIVSDADTEDFEVVGSMTNGKYIVKVNYVDFWDEICDLAETEEFSQVRFTIEDYVMYRTLGGSYILLGMGYQTFCEVMMNEIITNISKNIGGKILNIGSRCVYILCTPSCKSTIPDRNILGIDIKFKVERLNLC